MLPSSPRVGGLPSNPRGGPGGRQQRREGSSRQNGNVDAPSTSRRSERSPRPVASTARERSRGPSSSDRPPRRSNDSSSSSSSGSSSFLERMKNGASGYASSFTTVDDNYEEDDHKPVERISPREDNGAGSAGEGYGQVFWGRVATAASSLTVSVSKAWATNITTYAGEETPPGQESRLTRAMKAYHIEKARDPTDLPPWLFDEHERRPRRANPKEREIEDTAPRQRETKQTSAPRSAPPRGLRDVYDAVSTTVPIHQSGQTSTSSRGAVKGTDRLRAMREGKRGPVTGSSEEVERPRAAPQPRVGLPGGPGRARRA